MAGNGCGVPVERGDCHEIEACRYTVHSGSWATWAHHPGRHVDGKCVARMGGLNWDQRQRRCELFHYGAQLIRPSEWVGSRWDVWKQRTTRSQQRHHRAGNGIAPTTVELGKEALPTLSR